MIGLFCCLRINYYEIMTKGKFQEKGKKYEKKIYGLVEVVELSTSLKNLRPPLVGFNDVFNVHVPL